MRSHNRHVSASISEFTTYYRAKITARSSPACRPMTGVPSWRSSEIPSRICPPIGEIQTRGSQDQSNTSNRRKPKLPSLLHWVAAPPVCKLSKERVKPLARRREPLLQVIVHKLVPRLDGLDKGHLGLLVGCVKLSTPCLVHNAIDHESRRLHLLAGFMESLV